MITKISNNYSTSKDYDLLYEVAERCSVVCLVDYSINARDVGHTLYDETNGIIQVSARGICYIWANNLEEFVSQCEMVNLEWIVPFDIEPETTSQTVT